MPATRKKKATHQSQEPPVPYPGGQPTLLPCPACGQTVLVRIWREGQWVELAQPLTPALGANHVCQEGREIALCP